MTNEFLSINRHFSAVTEIKIVFEMPHPVTVLLLNKFVKSSSKNPQ